MGINEDGNREIIGFDIANTENEGSWEDFFVSLKKRGLKDVHLIASDNHKGLVKAVRRHFQGATWQRCQTHFSKNVLDATPKSLQPEVKEDLRKLYVAVDIDSARNIRDQLIDEYEDKAPRAMNLLDEALDDVTAVLTLPFKHRRKLRTTNMVERLNQEIRRRERAIRIFPIEASIIRLMSSLLIELDEKWHSGRRCFDMQMYYQSIDS